jgi:uncharacterized surface protein with fasciclin (FAS1) repeats
MKSAYALLSIIVFLTIMNSCKDDKNIADPEIDQVTVAEESQPQESTEESKARSNSVMARIMATNESKGFASYIISSELSTILLSEKGPFTVFAPSDEAFKTLDDEFVKSLPRKENKPQLIELVQSHIIEGDHNTVSLMQDLKQGRVTLTTLSGEKLTVSRKNNDILVTDSKGNVATVGKSDIQGGNGVLHIIDNVLGRASK